MTWFYFLHAFKRYVHYSLNNRTFAGNHNDLLVLVDICWSDPIWIAQHKSVAMSHHTAHHITAIPFFAALFKDRRHINIFLDQFADLIILIVRFLEFFKQPVIFLVKKVT